MAKKDKSVEINKKELTPTIIGEVGNKKRSLIPLIIIFIIFILFVVFLPDISFQIDKLLGKEAPINNIINEENTNEDESKPDEVEAAQRIPYIENGEIETTIFKIQKIIFGDNVLKYSLSNIHNDYINLANYNFFLEIYSEDNTLLKRIMLEKTAFAPEMIKDYEYLINVSAIDYFKLKEITQDEYPNVNLGQDDDKRSELVCTSPHETITYFFENDKLYGIKDEVNYNTNEFPNEVLFYNELNNTYNTKEGISATIEVSENLNFVAHLNLNLVKNVKELKNNYFYPLNSLPYIIKFELEANDFICH